MSDNSFSHARVRKLAITAMLTAVIWILVLTPIGYTVPVFGISMTVLHIPVIVGTLMEGLGVGSILGGMFGLSSLINAFQRPSLVSPLFQNPLVSVLPRLLIAPVSYGVLMLMRRLFPDRRKLHYAVVGLVGAVANTVFTLTAMTIWTQMNPSMVPLTTVAIWGFSINLLAEAPAAMIVNVAVMTALSKVYNRTK